MRCEPANTIITKFGGLKKVAEATGVTVHSVMRWRKERSEGGTGGMVPHWHVQALLDAAKDQQIALGPTDFLPASNGQPEKASA